MTKLLVLLMTLISCVEAVKEEAIHDIPGDTSSKSTEQEIIASISDLEITRPVHYIVCDGEDMPVRLKIYNEHDTIRFEHVNVQSNTPDVFFYETYAKSFDNNGNELPASNWYQRINTFIVHTDFVYSGETESFHLENIELKGNGYHSEIEDLRLDGDTIEFTFTSYDKGTTNTCSTYITK